MNDPAGGVAAVPLSWSRSDPEQVCLFNGGRFTRVNAFFAALLGALGTGAFYLALMAWPKSRLSIMFIKGGEIPPIIAAFTCWAVAILVVKWLKLRLQRRALGYLVVPPDPDFVLSPATVEYVSAAIYETVDDHRHFVLFNRIMVALSNLRNLGRITDVDEILRSQAENDEAGMETSYLFLQGLIWAIPVLGFIGTVLGLSKAIGGFGGVLAGASQIAELKPELQKVTAGLTEAFETTLEGLVAALLIQLAMTALKVAEQEFLDACHDYCLRHVVGRLRLLPLEPLRDDAP